MRICCVKTQGMPGHCEWPRPDPADCGAFLAHAQRVKLSALALTGYAREEQHRLALNCGYDEVLVKPVDLQDLLEAIRRVALEDHPQE